MSKFYAYVYLDPTKRGIYTAPLVTFLFKPFYIGKGQGDRMYAHLRQASLARKSTKNSHKINTIRKIQAKNQQPIIIKIYESNDEELALALEFALINSLKTSCGLTNIRDTPWVSGQHANTSTRCYLPTTTRTDTIVIYVSTIKEHLVIKKSTLPYYLTRYGESNIIITTGIVSRRGIQKHKARKGESNGMFGKTAIKGNRWVTVDGEEIFVSQAALLTLIERGTLFEYGRGLAMKPGKRIIFENEIKGKYRTDADIDARPQVKYQVGLIWSSSKPTYLNHKQL